MDFVNVKEWKIPVNGVNKDVIRVTDNQGRIIWEKTQPQTNEYLNFKTTSANTLTLTRDGSSSIAINLEYSYDKVNWTEWVENNNVRRIEIPANSTVYIRGNNESITSSDARNFYNFKSSQLIECHGNIMSLLDKTLQLKTISVDRCFSDLFKNMSKLLTAPELPATTLKNYCYYDMFYGCTSLIQAPELPATTLATYCYDTMFQGCTSLTTAPELPATTLKNSCYSSMFRNCTSLTQAPELPATNLALNCYNYMFRNCTSLTQAKVYATNNGSYASSSRAYMFKDCTASNAVLHVKSDLTWDSTNNNGSVGSNWSIVRDL